MPIAKKANLGRKAVILIIIIDQIASGQKFLKSQVEKAVETVALFQQRTPLAGQGDKGINFASKGRLEQGAQIMLSNSQLGEESRGKGEFKLSGHKGKKGMPVGEEKIAGQGAQIGKEGGTGAKFGPDLLIKGIGELQNGME